MMKKAYQITPEGKQELEQELAQLKGRRGSIADKIAEARDYGDLSENAEYDAAREEQGIVETRITEIEDILLNAELIIGGKKDAVGLGSVVTLKTGSKEVTYTVVGPVEANPLEGKISNESPIGEALMGKKVNDHVTINTPKGELDYTIQLIG
jgi:transcription elongation factor GreA